MQVELDSNGRRFAVWILDDMWGTRQQWGSCSPLCNFAWAHRSMSRGPTKWAMPLPTLHWVGPCNVPWGQHDDSCLNSGFGYIMHAISLSKTLS